jgi:antitoxin MazE
MRYKYRTKSLSNVELRRQEPTLSCAEPSPLARLQLNASSRHFRLNALAAVQRGQPRTKFQVEGGELGGTRLVVLLQQAQSLANDLAGGAGAPCGDTMYLQEGDMQAQVLKWGNSLAVRIPKPIADDARLQLGDPLEIAVAADGVVQMHRIGEVPTLAQLVAQITPENRYAEIPLGPEIGREAVEW